MPRSSETPPSGRALLVTGLRRCDGITRGCPYQATSQHHGKEQQTSIEAPAARHSGAGRNPETTRDIATPAQTGTPRPKPHQALHWVPACAGYPNMRPRLAANARRPINRRTGYRPAPVRRSPTRALFPTPIAPTSAENSKRPRKPETPVIPAQAGIQKPRSRSHHPSRQAPPRPKPHQAPNHIPAFAGTTGSQARLPLPSHSAAPRWRTANLHRSPRRPSFRRRPESRTRIRYRDIRPRLATNARSLIKRRTSRPNRHPATEAPPSAKLPTDPRRYDGLARGCACTRANPAQPPTRDLTD